VNSPEFEILKLAVRLDDQAAAVEEARRIISGHKIDWDDLFLRADMHSIKPQLAMLLSGMTETVVPAVFSEKIGDARRQNLYEQLSNVAEFFEIISMLREAGITAVPFKGFWLAHEYYGNLADREGVDIDLLIDYDDLDRVMELMPLRGYRLERSSDPGLVDKIKKESAELNFDRFEGDVRIFHVEFHWKIGSSFSGLDISLQELMPMTEMSMIQGRELLVFNASAGFLLALMHHAGKDPLIKLKQALDVGQMLAKEAEIDWDWVIGRARRYNIEKGVYIIVALASVLTGAEVPYVLRSRVETGQIRRLAEGRIKAMSLSPALWHKRGYGRGRLMFHLRTRTGFKIRARMIYDYLRAVIIGLVVPRAFLDYYLRKRYNITSRK